LSTAIRVLEEQPAPLLIAAKVELIDDIAV
jgi:hypothetical protein